MLSTVDCHAQSACDCCLLLKSQHSSFLLSPNHRCGAVLRLQSFARCAPDKPLPSLSQPSLHRMIIELLVAAAALLLPYLYSRIRYKRLQEYAHFPQLPPSTVLGHLQTVDDFVRRSPPKAHPGNFPAIWTIHDLTACADFLQMLLLLPCSKLWVDHQSCSLIFDLSPRPCWS